MQINITVEDQMNECKRHILSYLLQSRASNEEMMASLKAGDAPAKQFYNGLTLLFGCLKVCNVDDPQAQKDDDATTILDRYVCMGQRCMCDVWLERRRDLVAFRLLLEFACMWLYSAPHTITIRTNELTVTPTHAFFVPFLSLP